MAIKVYVSADIEGVTGIAHWDEASRDHPAYREFQERMTAETAVACQAAMAAGATEIVVKDARAVVATSLLNSCLPQHVSFGAGADIPTPWYRNLIPRSTLWFLWAITRLQGQAAIHWHTRSGAQFTTSN